jgi:hypothetical protein
MSLNSVLKTYGQIGTEVLKQAVAPHDATGKTQQSIRFVVDEEKLIFIARSYFELIEKGIKPSTKTDVKPSKEMIEFMTEYARARGMENPKSAAWAISVNQLKKGDKTHRQGGRVVYSDVMETFSDDLRTSLAKDFGKSIIEQTKKAFKK